MYSTLEDEQRLAPTIRGSTEVNQDMDERLLSISVELTSVKTIGTSESAAAIKTFGKGI